MRIFKVKEPSHCPVDHALLLVEKHKLKNGNTIKRSRLAYGVQYAYLLDQEQISKQVFDTLVYEVDPYTEPLLKHTSVFYIDGKQMRLDFFLRPRFGLRLLRTNHPELVPDWIVLGDEVTSNMLYNDKLQMKLDSVRQINDMITESLYPESI